MEISQMSRVQAKHCDNTINHLHQENNDKQSNSVDINQEKNTLNTIQKHDNNILLDF